MEFSDEISKYFRAMKVLVNQKFICTLGKVKYNKLYYKAIVVNLLSSITRDC